ncbi:tRNA dimethylallyltransferase [endosymbiont of Euscepes postfasciatus]|uniref:tRNA (adenosine(37)-N6)-dimethylallyltransferase MiaA n=1 Tax=endosymbiont of Euscepes postfasciatus TaxID=650377 RepID=UPI000DC71849|nr:tRNA (adenosine(37)-N6)-dimethylallyltransferase MiaA [endosymbiont of Euscepes postfasciatus]BBA84588.1 tRNA dimethylallyltransferase [endosymbiont of Euscepes postfasciatus]
MKKLPILFIIGQTASGKTDLSIKIKSIFPSLIEIVNMDSLSIYRDMNIGTAKVSKEILDKYPHKLINIRDPSQNYSVKEYYKDAINVINMCHINKKIPLFCGGSMFYFNTLINGISEYNMVNFTKVKTFINYKFSNYIDNKKIFNNVNNIYKKFKNNNEYKNIYKIKKILSIFITQGFIKYNFKKLNKKYNLYKFCILNNKDNIEKIIKNRFFKMIKNGFENEVRILYNRGDLNIENNKSIRSIGYKEMWLYLLGKISYKSFIEKTIKSNMILIKNQNKWIKKIKKNLLFMENNELYNKKIINIIYNIKNNI